MADDKKDKDINIEDLKVDPQWWMKLAMKKEGSGELVHVFDKDSKPFESTGSKDAEEKIQRLAKEGKLYMRETGRSRHFRQVEADGNTLKRSDKVEEIKLARTASDPVLGVLMKLTKHYFKWIGLDSLSGWVDKKIQQRDERIRFDEQYKNELKAMDPDQLKKLKETQKQEKKEKKQEKKRKKAENKEAQKKRKAEKKIENEQKKAEKKKKKAENKLRKEQQKAEKKAEKLRKQEEKLRKAQEKAQEKKELADYNLPSNSPIARVARAVGRMANASLDLAKNLFNRVFSRGGKASPLDAPNKIEDSIASMQPINLGDQRTHELENEKKEEQNERQVNNEQPTNTNEKNTNTKEETKEKEKDEDGFKFTLEVDGKEYNQDNIQNAPQKVQEMAKLLQQLSEQIKAQENTKQNENNVNNEIEQQNIVNDANNQQVNKQQQPAQSKPPLTEQIAAEKQAMDSVQNWRDTVATSLFSHRQDLTEEYQRIKSSPNKNAESMGKQYLSGAVFGVIAQDLGDAKQQVLDKLINGKPLGEEFDQFVRNGMDKSAEASIAIEGNNKKPMQEILGNAVRELSSQAGKENALSPRSVMIGRLISNAMTIANKEGLDLGLNRNELMAAQGAVNMAKIAQKYSNARQYLAQENPDLTTEAGRNAVRDLKLGAAVNSMLAQNRGEGNNVNRVQSILGHGALSEKNLEQMANNAKPSQDLTPDRIKKILEDPNGLEANKLGNDISKNILRQAQEKQVEGKAAELTLTKTAQQIDPPEVQLPNPFGMK